MDDLHAEIERRQAIADAATPEPCRAELLRALTDYINETGIGSTLLPDVVPPETGTLMDRLTEAEALVLEAVREGYADHADGCNGVFAGHRCKCKFSEWADKVAAIAAKEAP